MLVTATYTKPRFRCTDVYFENKVFTKLIFGIKLYNALIFFTFSSIIKRVLVTFVHLIKTFEDLQLILTFSISIKESPRFQWG